MTSDDAQPWWASGEGADGLGDEDPLDAHRRARAGDAGSSAADDGDARAPGGEGQWMGDALLALGRLASQAGRRVAARVGEPGTGRPVGADGGQAVGDSDPFSPHEDGAVCDACPVCIGLRAVRQVRPEVIAHLSDAAHHMSLALRAIADAQAEPDEGFTSIDLDP